MESKDEFQSKVEMLVDLLMRNIKVCTISLYETEKNSRKPILFMKMTLINLVCNLMNELSNPEVKNALKDNLEEFKKNIDEWLETMTEMKNEKDLH